jgi:hypothetical protein
MIWSGVPIEVGRQASLEFAQAESKSVDKVDMANGEEVRRYRIEPTVVIHSIDEAR